MFSGLFESLSSGVFWAAIVAAAAAFVYWLVKDKNPAPSPAPVPEVGQGRNVPAQGREKQLFVSEGMPKREAMELAANTPDAARKAKMLAVLGSDTTPENSGLSKDVAQAVERMRTGQDTRYEFVRHTNLGKLEEISKTTDSLKAFIPDVTEAERKQLHDSVLNVKNNDKDYAAGKLPSAEFHTVLTAALEKTRQAELARIEYAKKKAVETIQPPTPPDATTQTPAPPPTPPVAAPAASTPGR